MVTLLATMMLANSGDGLGRTMRDLAAGRSVRVLFYGQSITEQTWTSALADALQKRFPRAKIAV